VTRSAVFGVIAFFLALLPTYVKAQVSIPPQFPDVYIDRRNYTGNIQATDRNWFYQPSGQHPAIEYPASPTVTHVAYLKGNTISVTVRWHSDYEESLSGSLTWQGARLVVPGPSINDAGPYFINLTPSGSTVPVTLPSGGSFETTLTITGVPNYVAVGQLQVKFDLPLTDGIMLGNNGTNGEWQGWERACLLDSNPIGLQAVPWTDLLEYTCRWAFGQSGVSNVGRELTRGIHYGRYTPYNRNVYNPGGNWYFNDIETNAVSNYKLKAYLLAAGNPWSGQGIVTWINLDCRDFAGILFLAMQSHGINSQVDYITDQDPDKGFTYWPLCLAGSDSTDVANYWSGRFSFHYVVRSNSARFDAAASYRWDYNGSIWMNPVWDWNVGDHWQKHYNGAFRGLAYAKATYAVAPYSQSELLNNFYTSVRSPSGVE